MKLIFQYLKRHWVIVLVSTFFLILEIFSDLLQPTFMARIVDKGVASADVGQILQYGGIMLCIALAGGGAAIVRNYCSVKTSQTVAMEMREDLWKKIHTLSAGNMDRLKVGEVITRITNDVTHVQEFINRLMRMMIKAPVTCLGAMLLIVLETPSQAPVLLGVLIPAMGLLYVNMRVGHPRYLRLQAALDGVNRMSREFLNNIRVIKAFGTEDREERGFEGSSDHLRRANTSALQTVACFSPLTAFLVNFGIVVLLWNSGSARAGEIGRWMASVNYMAQVLSSVSKFASLMDTATRAAASSDRIGQVLAEEPAVLFAQEGPCRGSRVPQNCTGGCGSTLERSSRGSGSPAGAFSELCLKNVSFTYGGSSRPALEDISFTLRPGETLGIIGPTGAGKTTLIRLLQRSYDPAGGSITLNGLPLQSFTKKQLTDTVIAAGQTPLLFSGTIEDNLRMGKKDASEGELRRACDLAMATEFIDRAPQGFGTLLGQGGINLSGGQKQRLSLARALLKDPEVLLLDDCTGALDAVTEARVLDNLRSIGKTMILVSQRASTVLRADRILCMENGRMAGLGTHEELLSSCPLYREILRIQSPDGSPAIRVPSNRKGPFEASQMGGDVLGA